MSDTVPTVKIARPDLPGGYLLINKSDFDPATMKIYREQSKKQSATAKD